METQLKCAMLMSLKEMALRSVAASIWNDPDILSSISKIRRFKERYWNEFIDHKIKEKMIKLSIPGLLKEQLTYLIGPISLEFKKWEGNLRSFQDSIGNKVSLSGRVKLCWTTSGTINYQRTTEELIHSLSIQEMNLETCYKLACDICLEHDISFYWAQLPEEKKMKYVNFKPDSPDLPYCWPYILQGKQSELDYLWTKSDRNLTSFNQCAFEYYAGLCYKTAAKYFFQKLTTVERNASLIRSFKAALDNHSKSMYPEEKLSDVLHFLLAAMTPEQQAETIQMHPVDVLYCFLQWPLQDLFSENASHLWIYIPSSRYPALTKKIIDGYKKSDFCFPKLLQVFFMQSPHDFRKSFVEECISLHCLLCEFFRNKDSQSLRAFFRAIDAADRVKILFRNHVLQIFYYQILCYDPYPVEICLREITLTKEEKERLKKAFMRYLESEPKYDYQPSTQSDFKKIFQFFAKFDINSDEF